MGPIKFSYDSNEDADTSQLDLRVDMVIGSGETAETMLGFWRCFMLAIGYSEYSVDWAILARSYDLVPTNKAQDHIDLMEAKDDAT